MASEFIIERRVEFSETDMAGIMHFSNFFRFMETAEHEFLRSLGYSVVTRQTNPPVGWPRVHVDCDFFKPVAFEDLLVVRLTVTRKSEKSLGYQFDFFNKNDPDTLIARGNIVAACVTRDKNSGKMKSVPIPQEISSQIEVAGTPQD